MYDVDTPDLPEIEVEELDVEFINDDDYNVQDAIAELDSYAR